jgi:hypothetical protein
VENVIKNLLVDESAIEVSIRIPIDFEGSDVMAHLGNEGQIEHAVREAGRVATEAMFQKVADKHNKKQHFMSAENFKFRQDDRNEQTFVSPYGHIRISRPHFYNDHLKKGATPFEDETRMQDHRITPLAQYLLLESLAEKGPQATAEDFERKRGIRVSHHLVDEFLEDFGTKYQDERRALLDTVIREDWRPKWRSGPVGVEVESPEEDSAGLHLMEALHSEMQRPVLPMVQADAMKVGIREYEECLKDGRINYNKYQIRWRELDNAVVGFVAPDGPREPNEKVTLLERQYFSEYYSPDSLPSTTEQYLRACGVKSGAKILLHGDGDPAIWRRYAEAFEDYVRVEILDERHARLNLRVMADIFYPEETGKAPDWVERRLTELYEGRYDSFFNALNYLVRSAKQEDGKGLRTKRKYFRKNKNRIRYQDFLGVS